MYKDRGSSEHQKVAYQTGPNLRLPIRTVATAVKAMCQYCGTVTVGNSNPVTISVHIVTNMYGSHSTVNVCDSNPH